MASRFEQVAALSDNFSFRLQDQLKTLDNFRQQTNPKVYWFCTERHLLQFWKTKLQENDLPINHEVILLNELQSKEQYQKWAAVNTLCIATTAIQLLTEPVHQLLNTLQSYPIPLFILLHGWEQIGASIEIVEQERNDAITAFPINPIRVIPVANEALSEKNPLIVTDERAISTVCDWVQSQFMTLHTQQYEALCSNFLFQSEKEIKQSVQQKKHFLLQLKSELSIARGTVQMYANGDTPITAYFLEIYQRLHAALTQVNVQEILLNFESSQDASFVPDQSAESMRLRKVMLDQYIQQLNEVGTIETGANLAFQQFAKILKKDWQKNKTAWLNLQTAQNIKKEDLQYFEVSNALLEIETKVSEVANNVLPGLVNIIEIQLERAFYKEIAAIDKFLSEDTSTTSTEEVNEEDNKENFLTNIKPKKFLKDIMQSAHLIKKDTLEDLLQSIIYNINEACYQRFDQLKDTQIQSIILQQQTSLENYHDKILDIMRQHLEEHKSILEQLSQLEK